MFLLPMANMMENNGGDGKVFGFMTTGENWRMIIYDGRYFLSAYTPVSCIV